MIIATISSTGYIGVVVLMAMESACIPLPSEIVMPFAGYLVSAGRFDLGLVATAGALGSNIGSSIAYAVGYHGGRPLVEKWGSRVLASRHDLELVDRFFARFSAVAVFVGRLLPIIRTFISLLAGIARMSQPKFQIYTFIGSWPWCYALAYIGATLGKHWGDDPRFRDFMHRFDALVIVAFLLAFGWHIWRRRRHH